MRIHARPKLPMAAMFEPPNLDTPVRELVARYEAEISHFSLGPYLQYTPRQLLEHYNLEVDLASQLMMADKNERGALYSTLYDRLFTEIPHHPQLQKKQDPTDRLKSVKQIADGLAEYVDTESTYLELGPGDCLLSFEMAKRVKQVYAIDVSAEITTQRDRPDNFELILSDGSSVDVPENSVHLAYSNQLMEHLHPDDAITQLTAVRRALVRGGKYLCVTPHRFDGPADISRFFDETATGFHLREYTNHELYVAFKRAGFTKVYSPRRIRRRRVDFPLAPAIALENLLLPLPHRFRRRLYRHVSRLLRLRVVGEK